MGAYGQHIGTEENPLYSGDTAILVFDVTDDGTSSGADVSITDYDIVWKAFDDEGNVILTKDNTGGGGLTITDATNGVAEVRLDPQDTVDLSGEYDWESEATAPAGEVATIADGTMYFTRDKIS